MAPVSSVDNTSRAQNSQDKSCEYTRVTDILYPFSGLSTINPDIIANAARRGKNAHDACEAIVKGLGSWDVPEEIKGYVHSFELWWGEGKKVLAIEKRFFCSELMITGQVDYIIAAEEGAIILDLKTSSKPSKTWPIQGSAYSYLARKHGYDIRGIHFLHLSKHGAKPHLYVYDDQFELFTKCLDIYKHFFKKNDAKRIYK